MGEGKGGRLHWNPLPLWGSLERSLKSPYGDGAQLRRGVPFALGGGALSAPPLGNCCYLLVPPLSLQIGGTSSHVKLLAAFLYLLSLTLFPFAPMGAAILVGVATAPHPISTGNIRRTRSAARRSFFCCCSLTAASRLVSFERRCWRLTLLGDGDGGAGLQEQGQGLFRVEAPTTAPRGFKCPRAERVPLAQPLEVSWGLKLSYPSSLL